MAVAFLVRRVTLDPGGWTAVTPPVDCDNVLISNVEGASVLRIRTDAGDANTEITVSAGAERMVAAAANPTPPAIMGRTVATRFSASAVAFALKPDSGTGPAVLVWA